MLKAAFNAVGCKLNQYEMQVVAESLQPHGFVEVPFNSKADLYVINTCTVTGRADYTSRQMVRRALKKNPQAKVIITGCYAQLEPEFAGQFDDSVTLVDNIEKKNIPEIVLRHFDFDIKPDSETLISRMSGHSRAFIKIQEGCREQCSYCVIWKVRGKPRSREPEKIVEEISLLYENGYNEVVLTGVHIGKYRKKHNLTQLLQAIIEQTKIPRIRLSSLKPNEFRPELIELICSEPRICPHVHIPIQSGDDGVLSRMGRKYKIELVADLVGQLTNGRDSMTIGSDIIVGFPGETDSAFENTYSFIKDNRIHHLHVFSYSDRPGTPASEMSDKVAPEIKDSRSRKLRRLGTTKLKAHMISFIGKKLDVVVEDRAKKGILTGVTGNYLKVEFAGDESLFKKHIVVNIESLNGDVLTGSMSKAFNTKNS